MERPLPQLLRSSSEFGAHPGRDVAVDAVQVRSFTHVYPREAG